ncbi:MAG: phenylalanine--tRNA ligase subunit beta, partial [Thermoanaerobaculia bacterium]
MRFSLSWLADYVDLGDGFELEADAAGRHSTRRITEAAQREAFQIGERLTSVGLAVEGYPVQDFDGAEKASAGAGEPGLEVEVTSNRPDCMCHLGLARELAVALETPLGPPSIPLYGSFSSDGSSGAVVLEDPEGCPRYVARIIRGVRVGQSPEWLRRRLESIGQRSINNVVDVTNFVLWEMGQPLHAFDLATLPGGEVRVRRARAGERLVTLDGKERELDPEVLVIADRERAIAIAGVMGGLATEVTAATTDVLLESAHFDRRRIRIAARRLGLHTDASHRFERGADFGICDEASRRCAALLAEVAGGSVEEPALD